MFNLAVLHVDGKRRNEFVERHVTWLAEWHNYAEHNIRRMTQKNISNWKVRPFFKRSLCVDVSGLTYDDNQKPTKAHWRLTFSAQPQRFFLPLLVGLHGINDRYYITKVGHWRKDVLEGHAPFYFNFFPEKGIRTINLTVSFYLYLTYLHLKPREKCFFFRRWVTWWWHNNQR